MVAYSFTFNGRTLTALLFLSTTTFHIGYNVIFISICLFEIDCNFFCLLI